MMSEENEFHLLELIKNGLVMIHPVTVSFWVLFSEFIIYLLSL